MLVKAQLRQANHLADHLLNAENNEEIRTLDGRNLLDPHDVHDSIEAMRDTAGGNLRSCLHAKICPSPEVARRMTDDDWRQAADIFIREMGLKQHQVLLVLHTKNDRPHLHLVAGARNLETGKKYNDFKQYKRNIACQEAIVREMPHLADRPAAPGFDAAGRPKPGYRRSGKDYEQESRTGVPAAQVESDLRKLWIVTERNPTLFVAAAAKRGLIVAKGDKAIVAIDPAGGVHSLARRLGMKKREIEQAFAGLYLETAEAVRGPHTRRAANLAAARRRRIRGYDRHIRAWQYIDRLPGIAAGRWTEEERKAWGRRQFLRRRARELGLEIEAIPDGVTGIYRGRDGLTRLHLSESAETIRVSRELITVQSRRQGPTDNAIKAMLDAARAQGWQSINISGPQKFKEQAAREAARRGLPVTNPELREIWEDERQRLHASLSPPELAAEAADTSAPPPVPGESSDYPDPQAQTQSQTQSLGGATSAIDVGARIGQMLNDAMVWGGNEAAKARAEAPGLAPPPPPAAPGRRFDPRQIDDAINAGRAVRADEFQRFRRLDELQRQDYQRHGAPPVPPPPAPR